MHGRPPDKSVRRSNEPALVSVHRDRDNQAQACWTQTCRNCLDIADDCPAERLMEPDPSPTAVSQEHKWLGNETVCAIGTLFMAGMLIFCWFARGPDHPVY